MFQENKAVRLIRDAANSGAFGDNVELHQCVLDNDEACDDHFASDTVFIKLRLQQRSAKVTNCVDPVDVSVVMKMQNADRVARDVLNLDLQFYNEVTMYKEVLPFLKVNDEINSIFCKFYYGEATPNGDPEKCCVIMENLRECGYHMTEDRLFLDYDHCVLALQKLAKFHALSYYHKQNNRIEFFRQVEKLHETRWLLKNRDNSILYFKTGAERGFIPLIEKREHVDILQEFATKMAEPYEYVKHYILKPEEPVSVLCHGDFCRNNMLFKYDEHGKPMDVKFFDVTTARYASPVIDISFFLALNTTSEVRLKHWDDFLSVYHDALSTSVPGVRVPILEDIKQEMRNRAAFGYIIASAFLPFMLAEEKMDIDKLVKMSPEEVAEWVRTTGGREVTELIAAILRDFIAMKYL